MLVKQLLFIGLFFCFSAAASQVIPAYQFQGHLQAHGVSEPVVSSPACSGAELVFKAKIDQNGKVLYVRESKYGNKMSTRSKIPWTDIKRKLLALSFPPFKKAGKDSAVVTLMRVRCN